VKGKGRREEQIESGVKTETSGLDSFVGVSSAKRRTGLTDDGDNDDDGKKRTEKESNPYNQTRYQIAQMRQDARIGKRNNKTTCQNLVHSTRLEIPIGSRTSVADGDS